MKEKNGQLITLIRQTRGIDLSKYEVEFLNKSVQKRMVETYCATEDAYYTYLQQSHIESEIFLNSMQISYTEFFRNTLTFSVLEKIILPSIILKKGKSGRTEIRIWSAACAAGQETYSLAMLLKEFTNGNGEKINFRIFASDQSESQILEAQTGEYPASSLNNLNLRRVNKWFTKEGDNYRVHDELKENIEFSVFDLFNEKYSCPPSSIFGDFDIIVCANLLFYYKREFRKEIIRKTSNSLSRNGYLITGETERDILIQSGLHEVYPQTAIFQQ